MVPGEWHDWHDFYMLLGTASAALVSNKDKDLTAISAAPYVAYVALYFQVISMGVNERRRLHATYSRHSAVSFLKQFVAVLSPAICCGDVRK